MSADSENRSQELSGAPDGYVRRESLYKALGAAIGILGAILGLIRFFDAYREYVDVSVRNERIERINSDNRIEQKLDQHLLDRRR